MKNGETPLAAWRIYATAEKLHHLRDAADKAREYHLKTQEALEALFRSLPDSDPLRRCLPAIPEMTPLSARRGETSRASTPFGSPGAHVRLVSQR